MEHTYVIGDKVKFEDSSTSGTGTIVNILDKNVFTCFIIVESDDPADSYFEIYQSYHPTKPTREFSPNELVLLPQAKPVEDEKIVTGVVNYAPTLVKGVHGRLFVEGSCNDGTIGLSLTYLNGAKAGEPMFLNKKELLFASKVLAELAEVIDGME